MADPIAQLCQIIAEVLRDEPELEQTDLMVRVERAIASNAELLSALKTDEQMLQINQGNAIAFQTLVSGGTAYISPQVRMEPAQLQSLLEELIQYLQTTMPAIQQSVTGHQNQVIASMSGGTAIAHVDQLILVDRYPSNVGSPETIDFSGYLQSLITSYQHWQAFYTLTDAEGRQKQNITEPPVFDFGLMVQTVQKEQKPEQSGQNKEKEKIERLPVLDGLRKYADQQVLLVGRPGSGKSTALARLLWEEATFQKSEFFKNSDFSSQLRIPVLVELRYWQGSIDQLILKSFNRHGLTLTINQLESVLSRSLILFDGVNELPSEEARSQLSAFRRTHPKIPMIFTTRDLSLGGDLGIEKKLEMQPLKPEQMEAFVRAYVPEQAEAMLRQLKDRLRELATTPLLLWMLCQLFQQTGEIPENLGMVFRLFTQGYERNLKQDVVIESDRDWWKPVLQQLAWVMMQGETPTEFRVAIKRDEAVRVIAQFLDGKVPYAEDFARKCLRDLQRYHLIQAGIGYEELEFRHQMIQEYYAAEALLERLPNLTDEQLKRDYLNYLKWTEPIALMLALVDEEEQALRVVKLAMDDVDLMLGARLAGEVQPILQTTTINWINSLEIPQRLKYLCWFKASTYSEAALNDLLRAIKDPDSTFRVRAGEALVKISNEQVISALLECRDRDFETCWIVDITLRTIEARCTSPKLLQDLRFLDRNKVNTSEQRERAISKLRNDLRSSESDIRKNAAFKLAFNDIGDEEVIIELIEVLNDKTSKERSNAANMLGSLRHEKAIPVLLTMVGDPDQSVRMSVFLALGRFSDRKVVSGLLEILREPNFNPDFNPDIQRKVIDTLNKIFADSSEIFDEPLKDEIIDELIKAMRNTDDEVQFGAASALGNIGNEKAISALLKTLENSQYTHVRWSAATAIGEIGISSEEVIKQLSKTLNDCDPDVRWGAAESLAKLGCQSKEVINELLNALVHIDPYVRCRVIETLGGINDERVIKGLLEALNALDNSTRKNASEALGKTDNPSLLAEFWKLQIEKPEYYFHEAIAAIQNRYQFYNYELWQEAESIQKATTKLGDQ